MDNFAQATSNNMQKDGSTTNQHGRFPGFMEVPTTVEKSRWTPEYETYLRGQLTQALLCDFPNANFAPGSDGYIYVTRLIEEQKLQEKAHSKKNGKRVKTYRSVNAPATDTDTDESTDSEGDTKKKCVGFFSTGLPCNRWALSGRDVCEAHKPETLALKKEQKKEEENIKAEQKQQYIATKHLIKIEKIAKNYKIMTPVMQTAERRIKRRVKEYNVFAQSKLLPLAAQYFGNPPQGNQVVPPGNQVPGNQVVPPGNQVPASQVVPPGNQVPASQVVPPGNQVPGNQVVPPGNQVVPPGNQVPQVERDIVVFEDDSMDVENEHQYRMENNIGLHEETPLDKNRT